MTRVSQSIQSLLTSNFREERRGAAVKESLSIKMTGVSTTRVTSSIHWKITSAKCNFRCLAITRVCNQGGWDATWQIHLLIHQDVVPKLWGFINEDTSDFCSAKHHILVFTLIWVSSKEKTAVPFKTWVWVTCKKRSSGEGRERAKGKGQRIQRQRTKPFLPVKKHSLWNSAFTSLARAVRHGCSWDLRATSHLCSLYSQGRQRERGRSWLWVSLSIVCRGAEGSHCFILPTKDTNTAPSPQLPPSFHKKEILTLQRAKTISE